MFNFFGNDNNINTISDQDAADLDTWDNTPESAWGKVEREEDNQERFSLGLHGYDENANVIPCPYEAQTYDD